MTEHPILFNEPMSAAVRAGRKSQTRRAMTPQPFFDDRGLLWWHWSKHAGSACDQPVGAPSDAWLARSPYGVPGDHLWVRETFVAYGRWETRFSAKKGRDEWHFVDMTLETGREYRFDGALQNAKRDSVLPTWWRRPSIFMPRAAARTLLEVTSTRIERLQEISEEDAVAEGVESPDVERYDHDWSICPRCGGTRLYDAIGVNGGVLPDTDCMLCDTHAKRYRHLWDCLYAARGYGWDTNPWVWLVEFKRVGGTSE
ncbi:hypothetical protein KPA93_27865 [Burkholderia cenocepacia]|uniref:hypothetical protein n=1 Tax=Burkholderia cenocepacia TaxID=95486 RepID=UPI00285C6F7D|nr:hypothetical protein [Burkholderia cenocepacia]MDR8027037.1 hypothetical protein [Burkholderia cenocepacia]MDR8044289.1 hypothetical protein [Burkholderia cenocepacia]